MMKRFILYAVILVLMPLASQAQEVYRTFDYQSPELTPTTVEAKGRIAEQLRQLQDHKFSESARAARIIAAYEANDKAAADLKPFLDAVKEQLKDNVADVRVSTRLADSPCCLVAGANALSASMERMLRAMNQDVPHEKRTLEINAAHPLVEKMKGLSGDALKDAVELLYDQALIAEGSAIPDPGRFTKLLTQLMLK